jgi:alpha-glucosidase
VGDLYYPLFKGRDGCRTPMPWNAGQTNLGFSTGTPWLPLGPSHAALAVSLQEKDPASALAFARTMLKARKDHPSLREADLTLLLAKLPLLAFRRGEILCVFNLGHERSEFSLPPNIASLNLGTGEVAQKGGKLALGPLSAWFGRL